jgi:nucleotide-binding universal stress UspA family protein
MIKTILVSATGNESDMACWTSALGVARVLDAHIDALHVRIDPVEIAVAMSTEGAGGALLGGIIDDLKRDADEAETRAQSRFVEFCQRKKLPLVSTPAKLSAKPSAQWHVETGQEARWMATYGMTSDLAVASRGVAGDNAIARSTLETLLLESGRPLLIPGGSTASAALAGRVAVAWKPTSQSARAVAYAMPFLARAKKVTVLVVEEEEGRRDAADRLVAYFAWHGIAAAVERLAPGPDGAAETLLAVASDRAELLVMGGYGHTRLREWVFGGFTQHVLAEAPLSVLMAH